VALDDQFLAGGQLHPNEHVTLAEYYPLFRIICNKT
jgi:hypothetical protein